MRVVLNTKKRVAQSVLAGRDILVDIRLVSGDWLVNLREMLKREELLNLYSSVLNSRPRGQQVIEEEEHGSISLPPYLKIPKNFLPLFKNLWNGITDENFGKVSDFMIKFYKSTTTSQSPVDQAPIGQRESRQYIPKYNLYEQSENFDLHVERGDEKFDHANRVVNILRSKGMASQFGLTLDDLKKYFQGEKRVDHPAIYNYANTEMWNEEELSDLLRQLCGEKEQILLNGFELEAKSLS